MNDIKLYIKRAVLMILWVLGAVIIYNGLDYVISDDTKSQTRITFHDFYEEGDIDYLFVGTSHTVHAINATYLTEKTGDNFFNLSTSGQDYSNAYFAIKEAIETKNIKNVFFEVSVSRLKIEQSGKTSTYIISDYLQSPINRVNMILSTFDSENYINSLFRLRRNLDPMDLPTMEDLKALYEEKDQDYYKNYLAKKDNYLGKGQWAAVTTVTYGDTFSFDAHSSSLKHVEYDEASERAWTYLKKIADLCKKNDVNLVFFMTPYTETFIQYFGDYEKLTQKVYEVAAEKNVPVVDMNLVKPEYLNIIAADYYNPDHLKSATSEKVADFLMQYLKNPEGDYYYSSIRDKYPIDDDIISVMYEKTYITSNGEYTKKESAKGKIEKLRIDLSAYAYKDIKTDVEVWTVAKDENGEWADRTNIEVKKLDDYKGQILINNSDGVVRYRIRLLDPETKEVLYSTVTRFNMD